MKIKKKIFVILFLFFTQFFFSLLLFSSQITSQDVTFPSWELIIYRPQNNGDINDVRCYLRVLDMEDNDVTYSAIKATYEWIDIPDIANYYRGKYYLSGGMAMHLNLKKGKYKISFYTPSDKTNLFELPEDKKNQAFQWESNTFYYNTENPTKVIFLTPTANTNGFYDGGWWIDYKAPKYVKKRALPHINE